MIVRARLLIAARLRASLLVDGIDSQFAEGHELPARLRQRRYRTGHGRPIADGSGGGADFGRDGGVSQVATCNH